MSNMPTVSGPFTIYAGKHYRIRRRPEMLTPHNRDSWHIIEAILLVRQSADFWDLSVACRGHLHQGQTTSHKGPQSFIRYCIRSGWLEEAS